MNTKNTSSRRVRPTKEYPTDTEKTERNLCLQRIIIIHAYMVHRQEINWLLATAVTTEPSTLEGPKEALYALLREIRQPTNQTNQRGKFILHREAKQCRLTATPCIHIPYDMQAISSALFNRRGNIIHTNKTRYIVHGLSNAQNNWNTTNNVQRCF
jgi:hypothetical protein